MPSWRVHLFIGIILTGSLLYLFHYFDLWHVFITKQELQYLFWLHIWFAALLGSLFPDFDYRKTKIRHILGPAAGVFIILSIIYSNRYEPLELEPTSLFFILLLFILIPFLVGLVVPFKHHGPMHSLTAAGAFALFWIGLELVLFNFSFIHASMIGFFGFFGYISHLLLDGDIKILK